VASQDTIRKLRAALDQANARGESQEQVIADLVSIAKSLPGGVDALVGMYREVVKANRSDLGSAIEHALFAPSDFHASLPPQELDTSKSEPGDLGPAIVQAFARRSTPTRKTVKTIPSADGARYGQLGGKS
jgi:hypothetical protein